MPSNEVMAQRFVSNLKRIQHMPCALNPWLVAESAGLATLGALWSLQEPDPRHIYHKAFGRSALCTVKGELLADGLVRNPNKSKATRFLFDLAEFIDLDLWYTFLIDIAETGLYNFSSNLITLSGCGHVPSGRGINGHTPFGACDARGVLDTLFQWFNEGGTGPTSGSFIEVPPHRNWIAMCAASGQDVFGVPCPLTIQLKNITLGLVLDEHQGLPYTEAEVPDATFFDKTISFATGQNPDDFNHLIGFCGSNGITMPDNEIFANAGFIYMDYY